MTRWRRGGAFGVTRARAAVIAAALVGAAAVTTAGASPTPALAPGPVVVDQLGYGPGLPQRAALLSAADEPLPWTLEDYPGHILASGITQPLGFDPPSGQTVHLIDFSGGDTGGEFGRTGPDRQIRVGASLSVPFPIGDGRFAGLRRDALAFFYHQRSGTPIEARFVGAGHARQAGHLGTAPNQGDVAVTCRDRGVCTGVRDVAGGWYDAGDQGKYVVNGGIATWQLLDLVERARQAGSQGVPDGGLALPEAGNGVPDVLDEARWELNFLLAMQVPAGSGPDAGLVNHKVSDDAWTGFPTPPDQDPQPRHLAVPTTAATLNLAACAAKATRLFATADPAYSTRLLSAARTAYAAARAQPNRFPTTADDQGSGGYGDTDVSDEFYWAATELFLTTGEQAFREAIIASPLHGGAGLARGIGWPSTAGLADLSLARYPSGLSAAEVSTERAAVTAAADRSAATLAGQAFPVPYQPANGRYGWGSNSDVLNGALIAATAYDLTGRTAYRDTVVAALDYLFGRNPLGRSYVTGYGSTPPVNVHHRFWAHEVNPTSPAAPPGALAGGPNSGLEDPTAAAQLAGCAPQACYLDELAAYSVNEVAINWNSALAWVADWAVDHLGG